MIDNSFKYFANDRDNWYCTIIVYAAPFAAYLNTEVTLADFQLSGNIPLAYKELLNVIEIMWGAILNKAQSVMSWLDISSGPDLFSFLKRDNTWLLSLGMNLESFTLKTRDNWPLAIV